MAQENAMTLQTLDFNPQKSSFYPPETESGCGYSDTVQIDVDGYRKTFALGWYDFRINQWVNQDGNENDALDQMHLIWRLLPYSKYDRYK